MTAPGAAIAKPNKQTHLTWWTFPGNLSVYKFEVILIL